MLRRIHRIFGAILILPFLGWAATALIFFFKPGYGPAYSSLSVKTYELGDASFVANDPKWLEVRHLRTVLGAHLLVRTNEGWQHLKPDGQPWPSSEAEVRHLVEDATQGLDRYGKLVEVTPEKVTTDTGVDISVNWNRLSLYQMGRDTRMIDRIYKIHYLQWTGIESVDKVTGVAGLVLLVLMALTGTRLLLTKDADR